MPTVGITNLALTVGIDQIAAFEKAQREHKLLSHAYYVRLDVDLSAPFTRQRDARRGSEQYRQMLETRLKDAELRGEAHVAWMCQCA